MAAAGVALETETSRSNSLPGCEVKTLEEETAETFGVAGERFVIRELLGEGSFGAVYRCSLEGAPGEYAVKVINAMRIATLVGYPLELVAPRLKREIDILKHLGEHPRILKMHFAYFSEKTHRFYVVTELLKGGELFQAIIRRRGPFSESEGRLIFAQLVDAVCFCHTMGVAHRDLKLENCLFEDTESLTVKLCDYGQAKVLHGNGFTETAKTLTTTPAYTAPEVTNAVKAALPYDAFKADSFGLGVILYGLLCSALPDAAKGSKYERHRRWSDLSDDARDLIRQLLAPDPMQRLSAEQASQHPWLAPEAVGRKPSQTFRSKAHDARLLETGKVPAEALLAVQNVVMAVQRERGSCTWALGSEEGDRSFRYQQQHADEVFAEAKRLIATHIEHAAFTELQTIIEAGYSDLLALRKRSAAQIKRREDTLDSEEDFYDSYSAYSLLIAKIISAIDGTLRCIRGAPTRLELRHRLLQYAAEQLGRERAFLTGHLSRPETLRLFAVVTQLAEIIGARKLLLGSCRSSKSQNIIVASDQGLLPALQLADSPIDSEDLDSLESVEERAMNSRRADPPAVTEWWCRLTKVIDKIHQHIMVNLVELFSQSAGTSSEIAAG